MPDDESLGLMSTCHKCGGRHARTGLERFKPPQQALGPGQAFRIKEEEYVCRSCGNRVWGAVGAEDEPDESL